MKLLIKREFKDKITGEFYEKDTVVEFTEDRAKEILADKRELASEYEEAKKPRKKKTK